MTLDREVVDEAASKIERASARMTGEVARAIDFAGTIKEADGMNTSDLIEKLGTSHSLSKAQAKAIVDSTFKSIVEAAANGEEVTLPGFGKFKIRETAARDGRNPATGQTIKIAASKKLTFAPAKAVKDAING
jgi:DNA-binding protein HU-beta